MYVTLDAVDKILMARIRETLIRERRRSEFVPPEKTIAIDSDEFTVDNRMSSIRG